MGFTAKLKSQIPEPPLATRLGAVVIVCLVIVVGLAQTHVWSRVGGVPVWLCVTVLMMPLAMVSGSICAIHLNVFFLLYFLTPFFPHVTLYPFSQLTLLLLYAYVVMIIPGLRRSVGWLHVGKLDGQIWIYILATIVISCTALVAWVHFFSTDLKRYVGTLPNWPDGLMYLYGLLFCMFNAALEEIIWRGVIMEALDSALGPAIGSIILQAASFAVAHYLNGFPNEIIGSAMVFVYGLMLGAIRRKSRGLGACWIAHAAADFTIFCLIYYFIRRLAG